MLSTSTVMRAKNSNSLNRFLTEENMFRTFKDHASEECKFSQSLSEGRKHVKHFKDHAGEKLKFSQSLSDGRKHVPHFKDNASEKRKLSLK